MTVERSISTIYAIVFGFYALLATEIPGLFGFGIEQGGAEIDTAIGLSAGVVFLVVVAVEVGRIISTRMLPWRFLFALGGSVAAAWVVRAVVDQLPGQEFKAVGGYFYLATPLVAGLGLAAIWAEWRANQRLMKRALFADAGK